jgi:hypothetical protein
VTGFERAQGFQKLTRLFTLSSRFQRPHVDMFSLAEKGKLRRGMLKTNQGGKKRARRA